MDPATIISILITSALLLERLMKHVKKSKCLGGEIEFNENASAPDLSRLPLNPNKK